MHLENQHALSVVSAGKIGIVNFTRLTLATHCDTISEKEAIMKDILGFVRSLHQGRIDTVYATCHKDKAVYLISLQFFNHSLANILLDFSYKNSDNYLKKFEIAGDRGIYQYDSQQENSFSSSFLNSGSYQAETEFSPVDNIWLNELLREIELSIRGNQLIH
ncbi:hypothetical protein [Enterococcus pingfangensis]